jgi:hypothetical protein
MGMGFSSSKINIYSSYQGLQNLINKNKKKSKETKKFKKKVPKLFFELNFFKFFRKPP